jgi:hypothetical protein
MVPGVNLTEHVRIKVTYNTIKKPASQHESVQQTTRPPKPICASTSSRLVLTNQQRLRRIYNLLFSLLHYIIEPLCPSCKRRMLFLLYIISCLWVCLNLRRVFVVFIFSLRYVPLMFRTATVESHTPETFYVLQFHFFILRF